MTATTMITGDHPLTVTAIASGSVRSAIARMMKLSQGAEVVSFTGQELGRMNKQELAQVAESGVVFARVAPEQKLRLVKALQSKSEIVAMTGDGVNDAPALKL